MNKSTCSIDGCAKPHKAKSYCQSHYRKWKRWGDPLGEKPIKADCDAPGCKEPHKARGYCNFHYRRVLEHGTAREDVPRKQKNYCNIGDCGRAAVGFSLCGTHYQRLIRSGDVFKGRGRPIAERFWEKVQKASSGCWEWQGYRDDNGYGRLFDGNCMRPAHRLWFEHVNAITVSPDLHVDHRCHNRCCVNPEHLRIATPKQNGEYRKGASINSTSGIRGVAYREKSRKWEAHYTTGGEWVYVGSFATAHEADQAVRSARSRAFDFTEFNPADWAA